MPTNADVVDSFKKVADRDIELELQKSNGEIIVKIGDNDRIRHEYDISMRLRKVKGFVKYFCYFECNDNFFDSFKRGNGSGNQMKVFLMPYFPLSSMGMYRWTPDNLDVLKSNVF